MLYTATWALKRKKIQVEEEQLRTQAPGFWDDQKAAEAQMKKVKGLQQWIAGYQDVKTLADELQLAYDFYKDELVSEAEVDDAYAKAVSAIEELELKNMLRSEADQMDCVLKINSGSRRNGKPGLGFDADAHVYALGRGERLQAFGG